MDVFAVQRAIICYNILQEFIKKFRISLTAFCKMALYTLESCKKTGGDSRNSDH